MLLGDRMKIILSENGLTRRDFIREIGISEGYFSDIINGKITKISLPIAKLIGELYGYHYEWILNGTEPKMKQFSEEKPLTDIHQRAIMKIEKLSGTQVKAILAFVEALEHIHDIFQEEEKKDPETE